MLVIGHRGAPHEALENSFDSFTKALNIGCDGIELDLWGAKDHSLWVCHDDSLKRTSFSSDSILNLTKKKLNTIKLLNHEPIPKIEEVIEKYSKKIYLNIEIKDPREKSWEKFLLLAETVENCSNLVISSFNLKCLKWFHKKKENLQLALLWEGPINQKSEAYSILKDYPTWFFHPQADLLSEENMTYFKQHKKKIYAWVPFKGVEDHNKEKLWLKLYNLKIDGLCTNYPRELKTWLSYQNK